MHKSFKRYISKSRANKFPIFKRTKNIMKNWNQIFHPFHLLVNLNNSFLNYSHTIEKLFAENIEIFFSYDFEIRYFSATKKWFLFFGDFGLSRLTSSQFIQYHVAEFKKPTIPRSTPHLQDYSTCNNARLEFLFQALIQMNGAWKMVSKVRVWTQDLSVMTRPRLLAWNKKMFEIDLLRGKLTIGICVIVFTLFFIKKYFKTTT
jgi:hypothetical protein